MHVADGHGEGVRGVERLRRLGEAEQQRDHVLHLVLLGAAVADHRALDFGRRVFGDDEAGLRGGQQRDAARVPELQRAAGVDGVEQRFDGDGVGPALGEDLDERACGCDGGDRGRRRGPAP